MLRELRVTSCSWAWEQGGNSVWGAGRRLGARHHGFHMWTPYAIWFKKHNFQNVSGPQEYVVEVPPLIQPEHRVMWYELLYFDSNSKDKSCPTNWAVFPAVFLLNFPEGQKLVFPFDYIFYFFNFGGFLVIVYKLALFFLTSQLTVTRPLATLGCKLERTASSILLPGLRPASLHCEGIW